MPLSSTWIVGFNGDWNVRGNYLRHRAKSWFNGRVRRDRYQQQFDAFFMPACQNYHSLRQAMLRAR